MTIQRIKQDIAELKKAIEPEALKALVIFVDDEKNIIEIQGRDIAGCTWEEINEILESVPIHYYLPLSDLEEEEL